MSILRTGAGGRLSHVSRHYAVFLSENPGPLVQDDGPQKGVIITEVKDRLEQPPPARLFAMACSELDLGSPRISAVLPYLEELNISGWRNVVVGGHVFWTNLEPNSFSKP